MDILQDLPIRVSPSEVFAAISSPEGINQWWSESCSGTPQLGATYQLGFGPAYQWQATVTRCEADRAFEWRLTVADTDWTGTTVGFELMPTAEGTQVRFAHRGWPESNEHYRISCHCWAMYLRVLRRYLEYGETVPYAQRLDV